MGRSTWSHPLAVSTGPRGQKRNERGILSQAWSCKGRVTEPPGRERSMRRTRAVSIICMFWLLAVTGQALASEMPGSELANSGCDLGTGWYPNEPSITPELVSGGTFGRLWTTPVTGQVYAQ